MTNFIVYKQSIAATIRICWYFRSFRNLFVFFPLPFVLSPSNDKWNSRIRSEFDPSMWIGWRRLDLSQHIPLYISCKLIYCRLIVFQTPRHAWWPIANRMCVPHTDSLYCGLLKFFACSSHKYVCASTLTYLCILHACNWHRTAYDIHLIGISVYTSSGSPWVRGGLSLLYHITHTYVS